MGDESEKLEKHGEKIRMHFSPVRTKLRKTLTKGPHPLREPEDFLTQASDLNLQMRHYCSFYIMIVSFIKSLASVILTSVTNK